MIVELTVVPVGSGVSLSKYVAAAVLEIRKSGLKYRLTPMGTVIEGDWNEIMKTVKCVHDSLIGQTDRVWMHLMVDSRKDKKATMKSKLAAVAALNGKKSKR